MKRLTSRDAVMALGFIATAMASSSSFAAPTTNNVLSTPVRTEVIRAPRSSWKLIPTFGLGSSTINFEDGPATDPNNSVAISSKSTTAFGGGLLAEYRSRYFSFQTGALYQQFALSVETTLQSPQVTSSSNGIGRIDYLMLPLVAKANIPVSREFCFTAKLGAAVGVALGLDYSDETTRVFADTGETKTDSEHSNDSRGLRPVNPIAIGGLGLEYNWAEQWDFRVDALYLRTILPMNQFTTGKVYGDSIGATIGVGYRI